MYLKVVGGRAVLRDKNKKRRKKWGVILVYMTDGIRTVTSKANAKNGRATAEILEEFQMNHVS